MRWEGSLGVSSSLQPSKAAPHLVSSTVPQALLVLGLPLLLLRGGRRPGRQREQPVLDLEGPRPLPHVVLGRKEPLVALSDRETGGGGVGARKKERDASATKAREPSVRPLRAFCCCGLLLLLGTATYGSAGGVEVLTDLEHGAHLTGLARKILCLCVVHPLLYFRNLLLGLLDPALQVLCRHGVLHPCRSVHHHPPLGRVLLPTPHFYSLARFFFPRRSIDLVAGGNWEYSWRREIKDY